MINLVAISVADILRDVDYRSNSRSGGCSANLYKFDPKTGMVQFAARSIGGAAGWYQAVQIMDWDLLLDIIKQDAPDFEKNPKWDLVKDLSEVKAADAKVYCQCPAFRYYYSYIISQIDAGIQLES